MPTVVFYPDNGALAGLDIDDIKNALKNGLDVVVTSSSESDLTGTRTCTAGNIIWDATAADHILDFNDIMIRVNDSYDLATEAPVGAPTAGS